MNLSSGESHYNTLQYFGNITDIWVIFLTVVFPNLMKFANSLGYVLHMLGKEHEDFFIGVTKQTIAMRGEEEQQVSKRLASKYYAKS